MKLSAKYLVSSSILLLLFAVVFAIPFVPLDSSKPVDAAFLEQNGSDKAVVFFGFSHCTDVCPTSLAVISHLMNNTDKQAHWPQVAFIDIDNNSSGAAASRYAKQFHSSFKGVHANTVLLAKLKEDFGLNIRQQGEQIMHRGRTYILNRVNQQWYLVKSYNPDTFDAATLERDLY